MTILKIGKLKNVVLLYEKTLHKTFHFLAILFDIGSLYGILLDGNPVQAVCLLHFYSRFLGRIPDDIAYQNADGIFDVVFHFKVQAYEK